MKKYILLFTFILPLIAQAQDVEVLKFMPQLLQSNWSASANKSDSKVMVGLPVINNFGFNIYNSGFAIGDVFTQRGDTAVLSLSNIINGLKSENHVGVNLNYSLFALQINSKKMGIGFSINDRMNFKFTYPGDLAKLIQNGNGAYLGQTKNIGGFKLNVNYYREMALHLQKTFGKLNVGISPKLLFGIANMQTNNSKIDFFTDTSYFLIKTTSALDISTSGLDSASFNGLTSNWKGTAFNTKNMGFGLNIGASYNINNKLQVAAGINDLGKIKYNDHLTNYKSPAVEISFEGVDINNLIAKDSFKIERILDSLKGLFQLNQSVGNAYSISLPTQFYILANYKITKKHSLGGTVSLNSFNGKILPSLTACYQYTPSKKFGAAISYTAKSSAPVNVGGGIMLKALGMQWYLLSDNLLSVVNPLKAKSTNVILGMNLAFGNINKITKKQKQKFMKTAAENGKMQ
jgi:Family of unknown function (DUF5723)